MNKKLLIIFSALFAVVLISNCNQDNDLVIDEKYKSGGAELEYIEYGTSFGMCAGYCMKKITISDSKIIFEKKSWNIEEYPIVTITESYNQSDWINLLTKVDYESFQELNPIIGCPDCADGGAEWIELKKLNGEAYKVTFEYGNEPEVLQNFIQDLKELLSSYSEQ